MGSAPAVPAPSATLPLAIDALVKRFGRVDRGRRRLA